MASIRSFSIYFLALAMVAVSSSSFAQEAKPAEEPQPAARRVPQQPAPKAPDANSITSVTVETIMEGAVKNIAVRYNLNDEQAKLTQEMMKQRVHAFLKEHENEVWPLIRQFIDTQFGSKPPDDKEVVKRLGAAARPLAEQAKKAILEGNAEWRKHLTPEQRLMHDHDLAEMEGTFKDIYRNLDQWAEGNPPKGGIFPQPPPVDRSPPRPPRPTPGLPKLPEPEVVTFRETFFDLFVEQFIKDNELDPSQITSARSILNEFKAKATDFKISNKDEIAKVVAAQREAMESRDSEKTTAADEARRQLLQPIYQLFDEMEGRLTALLTSVQLERYKERKAAAEPGDRRKQIDEEVLPQPVSAKQAAKRPVPEPAKNEGGAPPE